MSRARNPMPVRETPGRFEIVLERGNVIRVHNAAGIRIGADSGVLWVTEENALEDHVLLPGDSVVLSQKGLAIVLAHRPARVIMDIPPGTVWPRTVEVAPVDGAAGRRIALTGSARLPLHALVRRVANVFTEALASIRAIGATSYWNVEAHDGADTFPPAMYLDGMPHGWPRPRMNRGGEVGRARRG